MTTQIRLPASLRELAQGQSTLELPGNTVGGVLSALAQHHPELADRLLDEQGQPYGYINLFVGGVDIRDTGGLETQLADGSELLIVSAVAGG